MTLKEFSKVSRKWHQGTCEVRLGPKCKAHWKRQLHEAMEEDTKMGVPNLNCDGNHCTSLGGETRRYELGGGAGLGLCRACWDHENAYRADRVRQGADPAAFPLESWDNAKVLSKEEQ